MIRMLIQGHKILLLLCFLPGMLWAQIPDNPNKKNAQGGKEGAWTVLYDEAWKEITDKSQAVYFRTATYKNGKTVGKVLDHYASGQVQMSIDNIISEEDGIFDGEVITYRENGDIAKYEFFQKGALDVDKTAIYYTDLLGKISEESGTNTPQYFDVLNQIVQHYYAAGAYLKVEPYLKESVQILKGALGEQNAAYAVYLENLSNLYRDLGNYKLSEKLLRNTLKIRQSVLGKKHRDFLIGFRNLAGLAYLKGNYKKAEQLYAQALPAIAKTLGENSEEYATSLNNFAELQSILGNYPTAEGYYTKTAEIYKSEMGENHPYYATALNNLANLFMAQKKYTDAEPTYLKSLEIIRKSQGTQHPSYALTLNNLARLYIATGKYLKAEALLKEALGIRKTQLGENHPNYALSLKSLGDLYGKKMQSQEAEKLLLQASKILLERLGENHPTYIEARSVLAKFYMNQKEYKKAEPIFKDVNEKFFKQIEDYFPFLSEYEKEEFYNNQIKSHFEEFNSYALMRYTQNPTILGQMYDNQLVTKALLLNASNKWKARIKKSGDLKLIRDFDKWQTEKAYLAKLYHDGNQADKEEIKELEQQLNDAEKKLSVRSEAFANIQDNRIVKWEEVRDYLKKGEAAIEIIRFHKYGQQRLVKDANGSNAYPTYGLTNDIYYAALIITEDSEDYPELVLMENGLDLEGKYLKNYRNKIKYKSKDELSYNHYWKPLKDRLKGIKKIYFSPEGVFNQISMSTLRNPSNGKFLFDEIDIQLVTNSKDLILGTEKDQLNKYALLFGAPNYGLESDERSKIVRSNTERGAEETDDEFSLNEEDEKEVYALNIERSNVNLAYLPGTKVEVESIGEMLENRDWQLEIYTGDDALEDHLKDSYKPNILHIATHGFFEKDPESGAGEKFLQNPLLRSGLMLTGAGHSLIQKEETFGDDDEFSLDDSGDENSSLEDGILTAYEAMSLNLDNTELVVLSACETGLGEIKNGEGVYGLQRAFKVAGARTVVMSLWNVNDQSTQMLMRNFYRFWLESGNKHEAFRQAQEALRAEYEDPYFWGAFVIVGE